MSKTYANSSASLFIIFLCFLVQTSDAAPCEFDRETLQFTGAPTDQAKCLLRPVMFGGKLGDDLNELPKSFRCLGAASDISAEKLEKFLFANKIDPEQLGGSLRKNISSTQSRQKAAYFVIHDTSTPNYAVGEFPADIDWSESVNNLCRWRQETKSVAHVFINRRGESTTAVDFSTPWRATKFEMGYGSTALRGLFIHVELIQPRRSDPRLSAGNDAIAPAPGFTDAQYDRLALVYLAASARKGACLIPTYHSVLDADLAGGHDDPQNFSLNDFAAAVDRVHTAIRNQ